MPEIHPRTTIEPTRAGRALDPSSPSEAQITGGAALMVGHRDAGASGTENQGSVHRLQRRLMELGYLSPNNADGSGSADGIFGPRTQEALRNFQAQAGLQRRDGMAGRETWPRLFEASAPRAPGTPAAPTPPPEQQAREREQTREFVQAREGLEQTTTQRPWTSEMSPRQRQSRAQQTSQRLAQVEQGLAGSQLPEERQREVRELIGQLRQLYQPSNLGGGLFFSGANQSRQVGQANEGEARLRQLLGGA
jgi:murein L,D-transpeptidase YcbB/YkuD